MPSSEKKGWQNIPPDNFKLPLNDIEIFKRIIDALPYPITVYSHDGTAVYSNEAALKIYQINPGMAIGKYNLFQDPTMIAAFSYEKLKAVQEGETVFFPSVRVPLKILSSRDGVDYDMEALYMDMTWFPLKVDGRVAYIVQHHIPCRVYKGKREIEQAKEYIDNNWLEKFDLKKVAKAAQLSQAHLTRLFRQHAGMTAHDYYTRIKISKLKEKLIDPDLSVAEAFSACNLDYNGHFARVFKDHAGVTPSEYKKIK